MTTVLQEDSSLQTMTIIAHQEDFSQQSMTIIALQDDIMHQNTTTTAPQDEPDLQSTMIILDAITLTPSFQLLQTIIPAATEGGPLPLKTTFPPSSLKKSIVRPSIPPTFFIQPLPILTNADDDDDAPRAITGAPANVADILLRGANLAIRPNPHHCHESRHDQRHEERHDEPTKHEPEPPASSSSKPKPTKSERFAAAAVYADNARAIFDGATAAKSFWDAHIQEHINARKQKKREAKAAQAEEEEEAREAEAERADSVTSAGDRDKEKDHHDHDHDGGKSKSGGKSGGRSTPYPSGSEHGDDDDDEAEYDSDRYCHYRDDGDANDDDGRKDHDIDGDNDTSDGSESDDDDSNDDDHGNSDGDDDDYDAGPAPFEVGDRVRLLQGGNNDAVFEVCRADAAADVYDVRVPGTEQVVGKGVAGDALKFVAFAS
ncbi:uncharacterized protein LTHEOB_3211 [Lasiodiplodia theobromae]|uniref:uncharacterized protein n=1 Tax=Lasiodiplodia theobromae TaxID=45133 RepID=UPI0015C39E31|nr:uncharacterized protein LTHEOB_3211 [Lasiodiplodia theobromae]KAF4534403.1 hypothetical protein LTHEOB_3211 [Lasiodiplodia theobromae]